MQIGDNEDIPDYETGSIASKYNNLWYNKLWMGLYFILTLFMDLIYFYFFPFIVFCLYVVFL